MYKSKPLFLQDSFPLTKALAVTSFSECRIFLYFYYVFLYHEKKYNYILNFILLVLRSFSFKLENTMK